LKHIVKIKQQNKATIGATLYYNLVNKTKDYCGSIIRINILQKDFW